MDPPNMKRKIKDIHQIMIDESPKYEKNNDKKCQKKSHLQPVLDSGGLGDWRQKYLQILNIQNK